MISLGFEFDTRSLRESLAGLPNALDDALEGALRQSAAAVVHSAKAEHAYTDRTGRLTRSIRAYAPRGRFSRDTLRVEIVAATDYASYVERGTTRSRPYAFLGPAAERNTDRIEHHAHDALEAALRATGLLR